MIRALLLAALLSGAAHAQDPLVSQVRARLSDAPLLRGKFEQHKKVAGFKKPLLSRGDFLLVRDRGVLWNTRTPFEATLTVTRTSLTAENQGTSAYHLETSKEPALAAVNELLLALVGGNLAVLEKRFRIEGELLGAEGWRITLTPTDAGISRVFRRATLQGDTFVRQVELDEAHGDVTRILFDQLAQNPPPTPPEASRLGK